MPHKVFISYSRNDLECVTELARDIDSLGHDAWLDHELSGGQRWWDQILGEIRACDVFAFAISSSALDSRACNSEYEYATALGKPVLPVAVNDDFTDGLMDPALAAVQRVNYTSRDKVAFAALNRALSTVATAPALPATLPPEPPVPASYLFDLKTEIAAPGGMGAEKQDEILRQFQTRLDEGHVQQDVLVLIRRFRQRSDLLVRVDREAASLEARLTDAAQAAPQRQPSSNTPPPHEAVQQPATPVAAAVIPHRLPRLRRRPPRRTWLPPLNRRLTSAPGGGWRPSCSASSAASSPGW